MVSVALLAQAFPSASSGVDWLYQFTNNLTNLTTQNGGALTQLGLTELSCISLFTLISMVVNWNTSAMTLRFHTHPVRAGDLTNFLLRLIVCCSAPELLGESVPRRELRHQSFLFATSPRRWSRHSIRTRSTSCSNLLKTAGDNTAMPSSRPRSRSFATSSCSSAGTRLGDSLRHQLQRIHSLRRDRALRPGLRAAADDADLSREVLSLPRCAHQLRDDSRRCRRLHLRLGRIHERISPTDLQRQLFDGDVACESDSLPWCLSPSSSTCCSFRA